MGQLSSFNIQRAKVEFDDGQSLSVRPVGTNDIMTLLADYGSTLTLIFNRITDQSGTGLETDDVRDAIFALAREFPDAAAAIIALACDDYDEEGIAVARQIPFPKQVELIEAVFSVTFVTEGDVKKLVESITRMLVRVSGALTTKDLLSHVGTGD